MYEKGKEVIKMAEHPIQGLMDTAMSNIKSMIDVNTIVGDPVTTPDGTVIIPISTVGFGFGAGGSQFCGAKKTAVTEGQNPMFGGGCGGGASVKPVAFLVVGNGTIKLLPISTEATSADKLTSLIPEVFEKINGLVLSMADKLSKKKKDKEQPQEDMTVEVSEKGE